VATRTEYTCRSGGSNLYAGALDDSTETSTAPLVTYASGNWVAGTGVFTVASGNPTSDGVTVGQWASVYPDGTTGSTVFIGRITARDATTITVSLAAKSGTAPTNGTGDRTLVVGGAWQGPNGTVSFPFGFIEANSTGTSSGRVRVNFRNDQTYSVTAAMTHSPTGACEFQGYTTAFGDGGRATIDGGTSGASYILLTASGAILTLADIEFKNNGASGSANLVVFSSARGMVYRCVLRDCRGSGLLVQAMCHVVECEAYGCNQSNTASKGGFEIGVGGNCTLLRPVAHDNAGSNSAGIVLNGGNSIQVTVIDGIVESNGGIGLNVVATTSVMVVGGSYRGNGSSNILLSASASVSYVENAVTETAGAYGVNNATATAISYVRNVAYRSNVSGPVNNTARVDEAGAITLTADPYVDAANGDFDLNAAAGGGALCRNAGRGAFLQTASGYAGTLAYPHLGASQHRDFSHDDRPYRVNGRGRPNR
jgi:hypothetical protein